MTELKLHSKDMLVSLIPLSSSTPSGRNTVILSMISTESLQCVSLGISVMLVISGILPSNPIIVEYMALDSR